MTQWRAHPRWDQYEVSDDGQVRSLDRVMPNRWGTQSRAHGRILRTFLRKGGYLGGNVSVDGQRLNFEVHVMVAETWLGPRPDGMHVRHLDGDRLNNRPTNLAWGTPSENAYDKVTHGTHHEVNQTHCVHGHEFTPANTYRAPSKPRARMCRTCIAEREAKRPRRSKTGRNRARPEPDGR